MGIANNYGARDVAPTSGLLKIYDVTKEGDNVNYDYVTLEPSSQYLAFQTAWTISTGHVYGYTGRLVSTPDERDFGKVAASNTNFAASTNLGTNVSFPANTKIQWRCAANTYRVRLRVYKIV